VWLYGAGHTRGPNLFDTVSIMTAPYAVVPGALQVRRLRSEGPTVFGTSQFVVGCGYAAHQAQSGTSNGVRLVRLSDGVSWYLPGDNALPWRWEQPIAVTCTEIFAHVTSRTSDSALNVDNYARVRLDSLGPGTPPD
jgi:hypothetical protein